GSPAGRTRPARTRRAVPRPARTHCRAAGAPPAAAARDPAPAAARRGVGVYGLPDRATNALGLAASVGWPEWLRASPGGDRNAGARRAAARPWPGGQALRRRRGELLPARRDRLMRAPSFS